MFYLYGRAYKENALWYSCAEFVILFGSLEELNNLCKLFLFFIGTCNIIKCCLALFIVCILNLGFAKAHFLAAKTAAAHFLHNEHPGNDENNHND